MSGQLEAPTAAEFCALMSAARRFRLPGWWDGSAYQSHPVGIHRRGIIYTDHWHVSDHCTAKVVLDPSSPMAERCHDSCANGNPYLRPERGGTLTVYDSGRWVGEDGPWREQVVEEMDRLRSEVAAAELVLASKKAEEERQREADRLATIEKAKAALAAVGGAA